MKHLASKQCTPCKAGAPPLQPGEVTLFNEGVDGWEAVDNHHLLKEFRFKDFKTALAFVNAIGEIAEREGHHPDIGLAWGRVTVTLYTHKINGLHENDFIMAAMIDGAYGDTHP